MVNVNNLIEKAGGVVGEVTGAAGRFTRQAGGVAQGVRNRFTGSGPKPLDDKTITRKVESTVFRDAGAPKDSVNVNTVDGVVFLRGEVKNPSQVKALEAAVRAIPEVRDVENLLHLPKTPAPTRADTPRRQQKTRTTKPRSASPRAAKRTEKVNTDKGKRQGEPAPDELAAKREGRQPAPLGSSDPDGGGDQPASAEAATPGKATAGKATAGKATASKATASKATASDSTTSRSTASKATAGKGTATKTTAGKPKT